MKLTAMDVESIQQQPTQEQSLENVLAMGKGDGEESYSKNSGFQMSLNKMPMAALSDALERVPFRSESNSSVVLADLGSSSGPNAIDNVAFIIDKLRHRLPKKDTEFQAYFNDLPSNDFNNLFSLLSRDSRAQKFFAAGAPGSYFNRLFAQSSVHVFFSSLGLHWMSKIPDAVLDKDSPAYNRGNPWIWHSRSAVAKCFQEQASLDLKRFLQARAAELVSGGLLFFYFLGRSTSEPNEPENDSFYTFQVELNDVWSDLIAEGLLTEHQRDTFNLPCYLRNMEEVREAIASCDSLFDVVTAKMDKIDLSWIDVYGPSEQHVLLKQVMGMFKALWNDLFEIHVGKEATEVIWCRYEKLAGKGLRMNPKFTGHMCVVDLIRK